jgi:cytidylate kinase
MALTPDQIQQAGSVVAEAASIRAAVVLLRREFAGMQASVVDAMDIRDETPVLQLGPRAIYLAASNGHCWSVTADPARADAFILTEA